MSPAIWLVPFVEHINPIRASFVNVYLKQAICSPCKKYYPGIILAPNYKEAPCVISSNCVYSNEASLECIPGLDLFAIYVNIELTYEDAIVMSRSAATKLIYTCRISVYLNPVKHSIHDIGDTIALFDTTWWQNHFGGIVLSRQP